MKYGGHPVIGFGQVGLVPPVAASPWPMVLATSVVSATAGWVLEEIASSVRKKKRR